MHNNIITKDGRGGRGAMSKPWAKQFYNSSAWQQTRYAYMVSRHGLCERCGKPGSIVHHRKALRPCDMGNPTRTLSWSNLELLCHHCHDMEHLSHHPPARCGFDPQGNILPPSTDFLRSPQDRTGDPFFTECFTRGGCSRRWYRLWKQKSA